MMIKKANLGDLKDLYDLENKVFKNDSFALNKSSFKYHLVNNDIYQSIIDENIVGYILWLKRKNYYRLYSLAIVEEYRGLGIASKLLEYSFNNLSKKSYSLEVRVSNIKAIKLYEKYGFKISKTLKNYYDSEDAFLMFKQN